MILIWKMKIGIFLLITFIIAYTESIYNNIIKICFCSINTLTYLDYRCIQS